MNTRSLAGLGMYAWPARLLPDRHRRLFVCVFFGLLLVGGLRIVRGYGSFTDEDSCRESGQVSMVYLYEVLPPAWRPARAAARLAATPARNRLRQYVDRDYGVAFELPMTLVEKASGYTTMRDILFLRHTCVFLVCFAGVVAFYWLGAQRFGSWRIGLLGAVLLVLSPRQFADAFYNAKDAVFLACYLLATATAVAFVQRPNLVRAIWHALACALAIDVRIMGVLLPACTLGFIGMRAVRGDYSGLRPMRALALYGSALVLLVIGLWPFLWAAPWTNFRVAFTNMSHFRWDEPILHQGRLLTTVRQLPWSYALVWIGITVPILYLIGVGLSAGLLVRQLTQRRWRLYATHGEWQDLLFWLLMGAPLGAVIALHSVLYDGWRQLYFVYPPLLLLALRGLVAAWHWQPPWPSLTASWRLGLAGLLAASLAATGTNMLRLHPLENLYFNAFAGSHPELRYEYDYWGLSLRQGLSWIAQHDTRARIRVSSNLVVTDLLNYYMLTPSEQARLVIVRGPKTADYFLTTYRAHWQPYPYGQPVYSLRVEDEGRRVFAIFRLH